MKIAVTMFCRHDDGFSDHVTVTGQHAIISNTGVILDGRPVVWRDRRAKKNREAGHPWISSPRDPVWEDKPRHLMPIEAWTGISVSIDDEARS